MSDFENLTDQQKFFLQVKQGGFIEAAVMAARAQSAHSDTSGRAFRRHPVGDPGISGHREMTLPSVGF